MDRAPTHTTHEPPAAPATAGIAFLASGSRGNCALVHADGRGVLVDCGLSAREALRRIADAGLADVHVEALLLTHEHADHLCGVRVVSRRLGVPVHATRGAIGRAGSALADVPDVITLSAGETLSLAGMRVTAFRTSHDAAEPVGYAFDTPGGRIGIATDTGILTEEAAEALAGVRLLGLEANHDLDLLEWGPYPAFLKRRIRSEVGHLSNADAALALERLASDGLQMLVGLHLSEQNNRPGLARDVLAARLTRLGLSGTRAAVASQYATVVCTL